MAVDKQHRTPPATGTVGMWLFLASLTMLFAATMVGYVVVRLRAPATSAGAVRLPWTLVLSTVLMLAGSVTIHLAVRAVQRERQRELRRWLGATCALAAAFVIVQTPAMADLLRQHSANRAAGLHVYGLIFFLILVHALHVVGGIVGLGLTTRAAFAGRYDHERYSGVKHASMYWHFLDVVWVVMYGAMLIAR